VPCPRNSMFMLFRGQDTDHSRNLEVVRMPKYLTMVSYTPEGIKGLVKQGGTARRVAVEKMLEGLGGRLEGFYFAFGENDAYVITEGPDNATAAAISLAITTGAIRTKTIVLLTPEELDEAVKLPIDCPVTAT
jgi:uncharacterized protein with GYD domain